MNTPGSLSSRPRPWVPGLIVAVAVLAVLAVAAYWWRGSMRGRIAQTASAVAPDLRGANPELVGRIQAALARIRRGQHPAEALAALTRLYYANGWLDPAADACAGMVKLEPRDPFWAYLLALLRGNRGQLEEALPLFRRTIALAPDYLPARLKAADALAKLNEADAAIAMEREVLERDPANVYALVGLGNIYASQAKWALARECFQQAVGKTSDCRPAWLGLVSVDEATGDAVAAADARTHVDEVSRSPESPDPWIEAMMDECYNVYYLRVQASSSLDAGFSRRLLERAVRLEPGDAPARRDLGLLLFRLLEFAEARRSLVQATELAPTDSENWLSLITVLRAVRDEAATGEAIRNGLARCPTSPGLWLERGRLLARAHDFAAALAAFAKAAQLEPGEAAPHVETAVVCFQLEQTERALRELRTALAVEPNHPFAQIVMARYAILTGDRETAQAFLEKARENPKVKPEDREQLVAAYEAAFGPPSR